MPRPDRDQVATFTLSLKRCLEAPAFLDDFYSAFIASSEEVRQKFRNTDLARQKRVLADSLFTLAVAAQANDDSPAWATMPGLAARHSHTDRDIRPELYDLWLDCLVEAARRYDPEFTSAIEAAWKATLAIGIDFMRSRY
jgi:hemoglobin-like flavoprotein